MADLPKWPALLPRPAASGYGYQPKAPFVRTDMDAGNARQRRRFRTFPTKVKLTWIFNRQQFGLFEAFVHHDTADSAGWFQIDLANGRGTTAMQTQFFQDPPYSVSLLASGLDLWSVSAEVNVKAMPVASVDEYTLMKVGVSTPEFAAIDDAFYTLFNNTMPAHDAWQE